MNNSKSAELYEKAKQYFPGGVNSPVRAFRSVGGTPLFIDKGKGCKIWDVDGNEYIDFCASWGPLILGHANDNVLSKVSEVMQKGTSFGAPTALENELAELIISNNPYIEKLRFVSSGTEAVMSAIRLARGVTGKDKIVKFEGCFHGHSDALLVKAGSGLVTFGNSSSSGVPLSVVNDTIVLPLNNIEALQSCFKQFKDQIAAVIIEPIPANNGLLIQTPEYLNFLRSICTENNALLIFDEVISGFRVGFCGAAGHYAIKPDIITYGKIIGGGFPVGAYGSSKEIMSNISPDGSVYQAGTLSGNPVAMAAGIAQLTQCLQENFYKDLENKTLIMVENIRKHILEKGYPVNVYSIASIFWFAFSEINPIRAAHQINPLSMQYFNKLFHYLLKNGVYFGPSGYEVGFVGQAHTSSDITKATEIIINGLDFVYN
jgi:glutamate-1-semialdehyde 2,1-aminomutase